MLLGPFIRILQRSSGSAAGAVEEAAPALTLLLSRSFNIGSVQLPWCPVEQPFSNPKVRWSSSAYQKQCRVKQQQHGRKSQQQTPLQTQSKRFRKHHLEDGVSTRASADRPQDDAWTSSVAPTALRLSRSAWPPQQQQRQLQECSKLPDTAGFRSDISHSSGRAASAAGTTVAAVSRAHRQAIPARLTDAGSASDSSQWLALPRALGLAAGAAGTEKLAAPMQVDGGQLMARIYKAESIGDMEQLLLQHHSRFRSYHVASAIAQLPLLQPDSDLNTRRRMTRLTTLLASGLLTVSQQLDPHQTLACFKALTTPVCLNPLQSAPLNRLMSMLVADQAAGLRSLHSYEIADAAAAAATVQLTVKQLQTLHQQQQDGQGEILLNSGKIGEANGSSLTATPGLLGAATAPAAAVVPAAAAGGGALALLSPLQQLWVYLKSVAQPQLDSFAAASLSLLAYSYAHAGQACNSFMLSIGNAALAKHRKLDSPQVIVQLLQALALSNSSNQQQLLGVLADAAVQHKAQFAPRQLAGAAAAFAQLGFYNQDACLAFCKVASRSLKHWPASDVVTLISALSRLRFRDEILLKAVVKQLPSKVAAGHLSAVQLADVLSAVVQLSYTQPDMEKFAVTCLHQVLHMSRELTPAAAIKLLWVSAVLGEGDTALQQQLLSKLADVRPKQLNQQLLKMLYQAHRLLTQGWLTGNGGEQVQQQLAEGGTTHYLSDGVWDSTDGDYVSSKGSGSVHHPTTPFLVVIGDDDGSCSDSDSGEVNVAKATSQQQQRGEAGLAGGFTLHDISDLGSSSSSSTWPPRLLTAARSAAALHACSSAARSRQQQLHVQDLFEDLGYEAPIKDLRLDGGALQPDLAFISTGQEQRKWRSPGNDKNAAAGELKVAVMCDHAGRYSRNAPYQLLGYETVTGWLLEQCGWKVVRLPPHEWRLLLSDRGVDEGTALAFLHNSLASQGVPL